MEQKTQVIELCDHYEFYSDNQEEANMDDNNEPKNPLDIEIPADETQGGYASGPDELEHSTNVPMLDLNQPMEPLMIGKKRRRQKKKKDGDANEDASGISS